LQLVRQTKKDSPIMRKRGKTLRDASRGGEPAYA